MSAARSGSNSILPVRTHNKNPPRGGFAVSAAGSGSNNIPLWGRTTKILPRGGFMCERGGDRTLNKRLKRTWVNPSIYSI